MPALSGEGRFAGAECDGLGVGVGLGFRLGNGLALGVGVGVVDRDVVGVGVGLGVVGVADGLSAGVGCGAVRLGRGGWRVVGAGGRRPVHSHDRSGRGVSGPGGRGRGRRRVLRRLRIGDVEAGQGAEGGEPGAFAHRDRVLAQPGQYEHKRSRLGADLAVEEDGLAVDGDDPMSLLLGERLGDRNHPVGA